MTKDNFSDSELDLLLQNAKQPELPMGFAERLNAKIAATQHDNIIYFPQKAKLAPASNKRVWFSAIPLAASLAVGLYLGAMAELPEMFSGLEDAVASLTGSSDLGIGIEDMESFLDGEIS